MTASTPSSDVSALLIAFDARARPALQAELDAMARRAGSEDRRALLLGALKLLARHQKSWAHLGAMDALPAALDQSEQTFERFTADLRSRFRDEMVRARELQWCPGCGAPPVLSPKWS